MNWHFAESAIGNETVWRGERSHNGGTIHVTGSTLEHAVSEAVATDERLGLTPAVPEFAPESV